MIACDSSYICSTNNILNVLQANTLIMSTLVTVKSLKGLSGPEATKYLLNLYIEGLRRSTKRETIESELIRIIALYLSEIFLRFDLCPTGYLNNIQANGTLIKYKGNMGDSILFGCSMGVKQGIHKWRIRIESMDEDKSRYLVDCIGVVNNIKKAVQLCKRQSLGRYGSRLALGSESYYLLGGEVIDCGDNNCVEWNSVNTGTKWIVGDTITVILNCKKWKLMFKINGKLIGKSVLISVNKFYHFFVLIQSKQLTLSFL